jgi:hypothetical protein
VPSKRASAKALATGSSTRIPTAAESSATLLG